jgi:hypothetical protein
MTGYWTISLVVSSFLFGLFIGWHGHTWYDGYKNSKIETQLIDDRLKEEKNSESDAANTEEKLTIDRQDAANSNVKLETDLAKTSTDCIVADSSVRDLRQAVTAHRRSK